MHREHYSRYAIGSYPVSEHKNSAIFLYFIKMICIEFETEIQKI